MSRSKSLILISLFAALSAVGAFIKIPLPIVPITLQFFFAILGGVFLGAKKGMMAQVVYVLIGLIGIPVFTKGGGPQYIFEPTFGYLIGFIVAAYIIGFITERAKTINFKCIFIASMISLVAIYIIGCLHMYLIFNLYIGQAYSAWRVITIGAIPFIASDTFSAILVSLVGAKIVPLVKNI